MGEGKKDDGGFALPPPIAGSWLTLPEHEAALICARLRECEVSSLTLSDDAHVRVLSLPFWKGWILCDVQPLIRSGQARGSATRAREKPQATDGPAIHSFVYGPDGFMALDGQSAPIHQHNAIHGIDLTSVTIQRDYLRFFCFFVRGEEGPFEILEDTDRLEVRSDQETIRKIKPLAAIRRKAAEKKDGQHLFSASIYYGTTLFNAEFALHSTGMVEMLDDELIRADVGISPSLQFRGSARWEMPPQEIQ